MQKYLSILIAFLFVKTVNTVGMQKVDINLGCQISYGYIKSSGMTGSVYYYPWLSYNSSTNTGISDNSLYKLKSYLSGGYTGDGSIIGPNHTNYTKPAVIATNVTASQITFQNNNLCASGGDCDGEIWKDLDYFTNSDGSPLSVPIKNFVFHMSGYLLVENSGMYTINIESIDGFAIINIGSNGFKTSNCCSNYSPTGDVSGNNTMETMWTSDGPSGVNQIVLQLSRFIVYPIEIFYVNTGGVGGMNISHTDPYGNKNYFLEDFIVQLHPNSVCDYYEGFVKTLDCKSDNDGANDDGDYGSISGVFTNSYLTDSPYTFTFNGIRETDTYWICSQLFTTVWTGLSTITSYSYSVNSHGNDYSTSLAIYIMTPPKTTTVSWTGNYTATVLSSITTTDSLGSTITSPIRVIETPYSTTSTPWTYMNTETYTSYSVVTNDIGETFTSPIVIVDIPEDTMLKEWTGSTMLFTTTEYVFTNSNGSLTTSPEVLLEFPMMTSTTAWDNTYTTTSVVNTVVSDGFGDVLSFSFFLVETPYSSTIIPWNNSYTSKYTSNFYVPDDYGDSSLTQIIVVETPYLTSAIPWTNSYTKTYTSNVVVTDNSGNITTSPLVIVETPYSTISIPWTNSYTTTYTSNVVVTNSVGETSTSPLVVVDIPEETLFTLWTGNSTVYTTSNYVTTDYNGNLTTSPVVLVEAPMETYTIPWNDTYITTFVSTGFLTDDAGDSSSYQIIVVETPYSTTTIPWNDTYTTTFTSNVVSTDNVGDISSYQIVVVETPEYTTKKIWTSNSTSTIIKTPHSTTISIPWNNTFSKASSTLQTTKSTIIPWSINSTSITTSTVKTPDSTITIPWTQTFTTTVTSIIVITNTDGKLTTSQIAVVETPTAGKTITIPWNGQYTTTFTTDSTVTGLNNSTSIIQIVVVETPSFSGWNSTTLKTSSIEEPSALITTAINTEIMTVTCTKYGCLTKNQESSSSNFVDSKISPSSLNSDTSSITSNIASSGKSTPSIDLFTQEISSPSLVTTYNTNKANTLSFNGLAILLLQLI